MRFLHLTILTALRDGAEEVEVRFGDGWALVYERVGGRDWLYADGSLLSGTARVVGRVQWFGRMIGDHQATCGGQRGEAVDRRLQPAGGGRLCECPGGENRQRRRRQRRKPPAVKLRHPVLPQADREPKPDAYVTAARHPGAS